MGDFFRMKIHLVPKLLIIFLLFLVIAGCDDKDKETKIVHQDTSKAVQVQKEVLTAKPPVKPAQKLKVTFIELGSVKCIPCKMMQPIMDEVAQAYKGQVKVVFYDVWTDEGRPYAEKYRVRGIPTQVFLDDNGEEFYRHVGFFPKDELVKVLELRGVK